MPTCAHRTTWQCRLLTKEDIQRFHAAFYAVPKKEMQDAFILKHVSAIPPQRPRKENPDKVKQSTLKYRITSIDGHEHPVCRDTFLSVLQIKKHRVLGVFHRFKSGQAVVPVETRGGSRKEKLFAHKREAVIAFIKQFKGTEFHYARNKSTRIYLPSELNIAKLHKMYLGSVGDDQEMKIKESYFRHVFNANFNLGFGSISTDECSICLELSERLKIEKKPDVIKDLKLKKTLHKKQAACFFEKLKEKPDDCLLLSFDCQKNLVLPKVSDQTAYYSRQLYCYNLALVSGISSAKLNQENVSFYTWTEDQAKKSSNEVASIVYNELNEKIGDFKRVRLVADGCPGQNKNVNMLTMCCRWLLKTPKVKSIELVFPVTGHSYMPADRAFGLIERELRRKTTIIDPSEYHAIFQRYGTLKIIGQHWSPYDWKTEASEVMKSAAQLHFQIKKCKRFLITKTAKNNVLISGEMVYNTDSGVSKVCCKKGKTVSQINPTQIDLGVPVNALKARDVKNLLQKHYGPDWGSIPSLQYYRNVLLSSTTDDIEDCECMEDPEDDSEVIALSV